MTLQINFSGSLLVIVNFSNSRAVFLVFRHNLLHFASELIEALRFNNLAITRGMDVLSNCIKNKVAHDLAQFTMLAYISFDENEITLGFKQRPLRTRCSH